MNEQHLILAVLAFESKLISLSQLTEAFDVWNQDRSVKLTEHLLQRGWVRVEELTQLELRLLDAAESSSVEIGVIDETAAPISSYTVSNGFQVTNATRVKISDAEASIGTWPCQLSDGQTTPDGDRGEASLPSARYTWISEVGKGGLGQVWMARDNELAREVALKEIRGDAATSEAIRRLIKEAQITGQLQHPNIVPVYEVHRGKRPFYTMKLVRGKTLSKTIQEHHEQRRAGKEDPISMPRLMGIFISVCNALAYAHSRGIIHRDLKPQNIVLGDFGEVIVLDWGLARSLGGELDAGELDVDDSSAPFSQVTLTDDALTDATLAGAALGTPAYMSPEQASGRVDLMDARTDVYGLGAILFEIVTGEAPHRLVAQAVNEDPSSLQTLPVNGVFKLLLQITGGPTPHIRNLDPQLPVELDVICAQAMAKERENRFQTVNSFKEAILEFRVHERSIQLATAASADLVLARTSHKYTDFNRALFGFEEAARQWPGNLRAAAGDRETRVTFAKAAYARGDYDLAVSMLDDRFSEQRLLRNVILFAIKERESRHVRIKYLRRFSLAASILVAVISSAAVFGVNVARLRAVSAREAATAARAEESRQRIIAQNERRIANQQTTTAERERQIANQQTKVAVEERQKAAEQLVRANLKAEEARWGLYIASLRLAAAQLEAGAIAFCNQTLLTNRPRGDESDLRGWEWNYLWNQTHSDLLTATGHESSVESVDFSPDGTRFVSGSEDQSIKLWDALSGKMVRTFEGHSGAVRCVRFSHDGTQIVSASDDRDVKVWEANTGALKLTLKGQASVQSAAFSPDDLRIVCGGSDGELKVWDARNGVEQLSLMGHTAAVLGVEFSRDGLRIVSGSGDRTVRIWDARSGLEQRKFAEHSSAVLSVCFSSDGQQVISGGENGLIKLSDVASGNHLRSFEGHTGPVRSVRLALQGQRLVSASEDKLIKVWELKSGGEVMTLHGHTDGVNGVCISSDDKRILSGSEDKVIKVWDAQSGFQALTLRGHQQQVASVAVSLDNRRVISGSADATAKVWDVYAGEQTMTLFGHNGPVRSVAFSPRGLLIATCGGLEQQPGELKLWHAQLGDEILNYVGHTDRVNSVHFSPDGHWLLSGSTDGTVKIWDVCSGELLRTLSGHTDAVTTVTYCPKGRHIISGSLDRTLKIWDAKTGEEIHTLRGHSEAVHTVGCSPDSLRIISGAGIAGKPGELKVWDVQSGEETFSLQGHMDVVDSASFSSDGKRILSSSKEGRLKIWDAQSGEELLAFKADSSGISSSTFCPNGFQILSGCQDGTLKVWDGRPESQSLDRAIEREARTALALMRSRTTSREQLINALQNDPTLSPAARHTALGWINALPLE